MDRYRASNPATLLSTAFTGAVTAPVVTVTRANGTALVSAQTATTAGSNRYQYTLASADTVLVDRLTATWSGTISGQAVTRRTHAEIAGDFLFEIDELRALGFSSTTTYPDAALAQIRTIVEEWIERRCGVAFVPRYERETISGTTGPLLALRWPRPRVIRSVTIDGTAVSPVTDVVALREGMAYYTWRLGYGNVVIDYEHGHDYAPEPVRDFALELARTALASPSSVTSSSGVRRITTDDGSIEYWEGAANTMFATPQGQELLSAYDLSVSIA